MSDPLLCAGNLTLALAPSSGGAIAGLWLDEAGSRYALMRPLPEAASDALHSACFPMVPFANCLRDNAFSFMGQRHHVTPNMAGARLNFHGSGWQLPWVLSEHSQDQARLVLEAEQDGWRYRAEQHFALTPSSLAITLSLRNCGLEPRPFSFGLHPWFPRHGKVLIRFGATGFWQLTPEGETTGLGGVPEALDFTDQRSLPRRALNECYEAWPGLAEIEWPLLGLGLQIASDPIFSRLMVYSPYYDPEIFCLEPQSCPPCGFDSLETDPLALGAHILAPGETMSGKVTLRLMRKEPLACRD